MLSDFPQCRRSSTVSSQKNHECMWNYVEQKPGTMICKCFDQLKISQMVLHCILRNYLYLYPYKVQLVQTADRSSTLKLFKLFNPNSDEDSKFVPKLITSDKAHFHLNRFVNKQNCEIWRLKKPKTIHAHVLHLLKWTFSCDVMLERIIGPYFFEDEYSNILTTTTEHYQNILHPAVQNKPDMWFQKDGCTHGLATMEFLRLLLATR